MESADLIDARLILTDLLGTLHRRRSRWVAWNSDTSPDIELLLRFTDVGGIDVPVDLREAIEGVPPAFPVLTARSAYGRLLDAGIAAGTALEAELQARQVDAGDGVRALEESERSRRGRSPNRRASYKKIVSAG